ncbi:MAG: hypothetical protein QW350_05775 [Candidatus Aenigmatarchaeota archaeon]
MWVDCCNSFRPIQIEGDQGIAKNYPLYDENILRKNKFKDVSSSCCIPPWWPKNNINIDSESSVDAKRVSCHDRKCLKNDGCFRTLVTYDLDTCIIQYRPRLINVPSPGIPDIDCAIKCLEQRKGGYVIKLCPGTHILTKSIIENTDDLVILGDPCPFAGMAYTSGIRRNPDYIRGSLGEDFGMLGQGPFILTASGSKITVQGIKDPDFSCISWQRRFVTFFKRDGSLSQGVVTAVDKNSLVFDQIIGSGILPPGEGFFFNPNVTLKFQGERQSILPSNRLHIDGITLEGTHFVLGSLGSYFNITRCITTPKSFLVIQGRFNIMRPNTFTGIVHLRSGAIGSAQGQNFVGKESSLEVDGCLGCTWTLGVFASTRLAARIYNGSNVNLHGNQFINNGIGLFCGFGSTSIIYACVFFANKWGVMCNYNSIVTNCTNNFLKSIHPPPLFKQNVYALEACYNSHIIIPKACFVKNEKHAIIDGKVYVTSASIPVGIYSPKLSIIVDVNNPFDINPSDTKIVEGDDNSSLIASSFDGIVGIHGIASRNVINGEQIPGNVVNSFISQINNGTSSDAIGNNNISNKEIVFTETEVSTTTTSVSSSSVVGEPNMVVCSTTGYTP